MGQKPSLSASNGTLHINPGTEEIFTKPSS